MKRSIEAKKPNQSGKEAMNEYDTHSASLIYSERNFALFPACDSRGSWRLDSLVRTALERNVICCFGDYFKVFFNRSTRKRLSFRLFSLLASSMPSFPAGTIEAIYPLFALSYTEFFFSFSSTRLIGVLFAARVGICIFPSIRIQITAHRRIKQLAVFHVFDISYT